MDPARGPLFGRPTEDPLDHPTLRVVLRNIEHTPPGATIRIVGYSLTIREVAAALVDAHDRGARVQVVLNGHSRQYTASRMLRDGVGQDISTRSFVVFTRHSARGGDDFGVTHQKSWSFATLTDAGVDVAHGSDYEADDYVHNKLLLVDHRGDGRPHRLISTGSDNWGRRSLHNDDLVLMIDADRRPRLYQRYVDYVEEIHRRGESTGSRHRSS